VASRRAAHSAYDAIEMPIQSALCRLEGSIPDRSLAWAGRVLKLPHMQAFAYNPCAGPSNAQAIKLANAIPFLTPRAVHGGVSSVRRSRHPRSRPKTPTHNPNLAVRPRS
jgi:hypothetical protein